MGLFSRGFIHGLIFALLTEVGLYHDRVYTRVSFTWQFMVCKYKKRRCDNDKPE